LFPTQQLNKFVLFCIDEKHSHRRSNVFGDAKFRFLPKPNQILPNLSKFYLSKFIQPYITQICPNFAQIYLKNLLTDAHYPAPTLLMKSNILWKLIHK